MMIQTIRLYREWNSQCLCCADGRGERELGFIEGELLEGGGGAR